MKDSTSQGSSSAKYAIASVIQMADSSSSATTIQSPSHRTVTASDSQKSVQLRFAPREVRQSEAESKTN